MGPDVQTVENRNVATPLAENIVKMLQGELSAGAFQLGPGPQQRRAGTALDQFVSTLEQRLGDPNRTSELVGALETQSARRTNRQAGDLREAFGAAGNRFSTGLANSEALLRAESLANLDAIAGNVALQQEQFDTNALLQGISQLFSQGQQTRQLDLGTLLEIGTAGVNRPETIAGPGLGETILSGLFDVGASYAGAG